jgi:hypothetical protein
MEEWSREAEDVEEKDNNAAYDSCLVNLNPDKVLKKC